MGGRHLSLPYLPGPRTQGQVLSVVVTWGLTSSGWKSISHLGFDSQEMLSCPLSIVCTWRHSAAGLGSLLCGEL